MTAPRACVIGWPIRHSRSPIIHGYWLKRYGIDGSYGREAIPPEHVRAFLRSLPAHGYVGCNVTIPHKEAAFETVEIADDATLRLKVVNTVYLRDGKVRGTSTDGYGFIANLKQSIDGWTPAGQRAVLLGAGGAARAIVGALIDNGVVEVVVANRSLEKAEKLQADFGPKVLPLAWTRASDALQDADLLVNCTSLGMAGQPELNISLDRLPNTCVVTDIVYAPLETKLLGDARARGLKTVSGLGMLLHQAVRGFELWFEVRPEVTPELYRLVATDIENSK